MTQPNRPEARTFFVNGHRCEIECLGRERWAGYIDGERVLRRHSAKAVRSPLEQDAKYRVEVEGPSQDEIEEVVLDYLSQTTMWVPTDVIDDDLFPEEMLGAYPALLSLEGRREIEETYYYDGMNPEQMWRKT